MKAYSLDLRQKLLMPTLKVTFLNGVSKTIRVALSFVEKLLKQCRETGSIAPKCEQQTSTKLNYEQLMVLKQLVETTNDATLDELRYQLEQQTSVLIGRSTVDRMLTKLNPSKNTPPYGKRVSGVQRFEFWQLMQGGWHSYLIFIDESGINLALTDYSPAHRKGKEREGYVLKKRGKNVSLIGAIGLNGLPSASWRLHRWSDI